MAQEVGCTWERVAGLRFPVPKLWPFVAEEVLHALGSQFVGDAVQGLHQLRTLEGEEVRRVVPINNRWPLVPSIPGRGNEVIEERFRRFCALHAVSQRDWH